MKIKVIAPGQGSSGFYPESTLKEAGARGVFPAGTPMYFTSGDNHRNRAENPHELAAVTTSPAQWQPSGPDGPGLYAEAKAFSDYAGTVSEKGPHIGVSIVADGIVETGTLPNGQEGRIVTEISHGYTIDFVPRAGAGGKVLTESERQEKNIERLVENATIRNDEPLPAGDDKENKIMGLEEKLQEARVSLAESVAANDGLTAENKRLAEANDTLQAENTRLVTESQARDIAGKFWSEDKYKAVPVAMRTVFENAAFANLPIADGKLQGEKLLESLRKSADAYIESLPAGSNAGVQGYGDVPFNDEMAKIAEADAKRYAERYGISESQAAQVLGGR